MRRIKKKDETWFALGVTVAITALLAVLMTAFSVNVLEDYGFTLFTLVPFGMGILSSMVYGHFRNRTWKMTIKVSLLSMFIASGFLMIFQIEGLICLVMASPILMACNIVGASLGHRISESRRNMINVFAFNFLMLPLLLTTESEITTQDGGMVQVSTAIEIDASIEEVWKNVVRFPDIPEPTEWIFKTGIAYPTSSKIVGENENAIRYCEFTTGAFVEPIVVWNEPYHLEFSVEEQPAPLRDMLTDEVPGNMYKYFVSSKGEFRLTETEDGKTLLTGTTWYYHKIRPVAYWKVWSDFIIHSIHYRVLEHIKKVSETKKPI